MNAQKLRNNKIAVGNTKPRKDALQVIENLRTAEFFSLVKAARNWDKSLNDRRDIMFTTYENEHSRVCKEFDRIFERRRLFDEREREMLELDCQQSQIERVTEVSPSKECVKQDEKSTSPKEISEIKRNSSYKSTVIGTSRLIKIPKKQVIKIARRKGMNDRNNKVNSVCIDNRLREMFFADCKKGKHFEDTRLYEIMYNEYDKDIYEKWSKIVDEVFQEGLKKE